ncbi:MAG: NAD(P)/FAD-dependent oxidoreductase [Chitinophagales bacterium]
MQNKHVAIFGAGLVGSLLSMYLIRRGYRVDVYERRPDFRKNAAAGGRSINLAISDRGWKALHEVGIEEAIRKLAIPMPGRMIHAVDGALQFQAYGKEGQYINSVSRGDLNIAMVDAAEKAGAVFHFDQRILEMDPECNTAYMEDAVTGKKYTLTPDLLIGADGAFSMLRLTMMKTDGFNYAQQYEEHSYKELHIPPAADGSHRIEKNALHIWPRKSFMLIALPNLDGSFTVTLFHFTKGENSFAQITDTEKLDAFFAEYFPDVVPHLPNLHADFFGNPTGSLMTVKCFPWSKGNAFLIGDAAHAIIPFYGQGMNCGFEDCSVLNALLDAHADDWEQVIPVYERTRKPNSDAIADLAKLNFVEMRDLVADPDFQFKRKMAAKVAEKFPDQFIPVYSMVSFSHLPYADALKEYKRQDEVLSTFLQKPDIRSEWETKYFEEIANALCNL